MNEGFDRLPRGWAAGGLSCLSETLGPTGCQPTSGINNEAEQRQRRGDDGAGRFEVRRYPYPQIDDVSMVIELEMCGICGTDKHTFRGETVQYAGTPAESHTPFPIIPGPEAAQLLLQLCRERARCRKRLISDGLRPFECAADDPEGGSRDLAASIERRREGAAVAGGWRISITGAAEQRRHAAKHAADDAAHDAAGAGKDGAVPPGRRRLRRCPPPPRAPRRGSAPAPAVANER